ncbi:MAG: hypothetical protein K2Y71_15545 [Xanthobacteraceae bacterium]|nr:hypothetical protein [Xanthobacteraceae bacterium]
MKLRIAVLISCLIIGVPSAAHEVLRTSNGGRLVKTDAYSVELVVKDDALTVYLTDLKGRPVSTVAFKAHATLDVDGKEQHILLERQQSGSWSGKSPLLLPPEGRIAIHLTASDGKTTRVSFHAPRD